MSHLTFISKIASVLEEHHRRTGYRVNNIMYIDYVHTSKNL